MHSIYSGMSNKFSFSSTVTLSDAIADISGDVITSRPTPGERSIDAPHRNEHTCTHSYNVCALLLFHSVSPSTASVQTTTTSLPPQLTPSEHLQIKGLCIHRAQLLILCKATHKILYISINHRGWNGHLELQLYSNSITIS